MNIRDRADQIFASDTPDSYATVAFVHDGIVIMHNGKVVGVLHDHSDYTGGMEIGLWNYYVMPVER